MEATVRVLGGAMDPDAKIRAEWAASLCELMQRFGFTAKKLKHELEPYGVHVSRQSVEAWMRGTWAPSPHRQAAIAAVFGLSARHVFAIADLPKAS